MGVDTFVNFMCVWGSHGKLNHKSFMGPFLIQSIFVVCVCVCVLEGSCNCVQI